MRGGSTGTDLILRENDTIHVNPEAIHTAATAWFTDWYMMPVSDLATLHTIDDWKPHLTDISTFRAAFPDCQVPLHLMETIFDALQDVPRAELVHDQLTMDLAQAPSLQEFECKIRYLKGNSSPGP